MRTVVAWLARRATLLLAVGVFAGLAFPGLAAALRPLLTPAVWGLLLLALVRLDWAAVGDQARRPVTVALVVAFLLLASPLLMAAAVSAIGVPAGVATAMVLMAAAPPIVSSPAIALIIGLDAALTLVAMGLATLAAPLVLPMTAFLLLGLSLDLAVGALMIDMALFIGSAVAIAAVVRRGLGARLLATSARGIDAVAVVLLIVFAIAIMDGVAARIEADPGWVLGIAAAAFAANLALQAAGALAFAALGRRRALTAGFIGGNRNMALLFAVLPAGLEPDVVLYFALGQIPIYVLPAVLAPLYRRLLRSGAPG